MQHEPDPTLIHHVKSGTLRAFNQLIDMNKNQVFQFCMSVLKNREESEEVAQDVFIKLYTSIKKFKGESKFTTWLYRITYNECISRLRKNKKYSNQIDLDDVKYELPFIENGFENLENNDKTRILESALEKLDEDSSAIVMMFYYHEKKVEEIAEIMAMTITNVKTRLFRARKKLLQILETKLKLNKKEII